MERQAKEQASSQGGKEGSEYKEKEEEMCLLYAYNQNCERSGECTMVCNEDSISSQ